MSKFFTFRQNNSGGIDHIDENLNRYVIIEANDAQHANERAQEIGIYFDGVSDGTVVTSLKRRIIKKRAADVLTKVSSK